MNLIVQAIKALFRKVDKDVKALRSSVAQSNWSQNDESAPDYIHNRTHYSYLSQIGQIHYDDPSTGGSIDWELFDKFVEGKEYVAVIDDERHIGKCESRWGWGASDGAFYIGDNGDETYIEFGKPVSNVEFYETAFKKLDREYLDLPDNIATTEDVQSAVDLADVAQTTANNAQTTANNAQTTANSKMAQANPSGTGRFSVNGTASGSKTVAFGEGTVAQYPHSFVTGKFNLEAPSGFYEVQDETGTYKTSYHGEGVYYGASYTFDETFGQFAIVDRKLVKNDALLTIPKGSYVVQKNSNYSMCYYGEDGVAERVSSDIVFSNVTVKTRKSFASDEKYAHIVGNGTSTSERSNAHTLDWEGNAWYAGTVEGTGLIVKSSGGKRFRITVDDSGSLTATEVTE